MSRKVICPLCNGSELNLVTNKVRFGHNADVYRCGRCNLTFLDQDSFNFPKDFYEKQYHQTYITHIEPDALNPKAYYEKMKKANRIWADRFRNLLSGGETVLDIGCSTGHFIDLVKDRAGEIYGHELNTKEVDFCTNILNLDVSNQPLRERFGEKTFDYITLIYVLEHISNPKEFLNSIKRFLKPNGKLVVLIPNVRDALVSFYDIPEFRSFYYCIEHLFYYSPDTVELLFQKVGLEGEIEVVQEYPIANHLNWAYRRKPSDTLASRKGVPDVILNTAAPVDAWSEIWDMFNAQYNKFLKENGFGDRIWCVVGEAKNE